MKLYYTQDKISTNFKNFFNSIVSISKPHLKVIFYLLLGMISSKSVVSSDISRKLKDAFALVYLESIERKFRRFFLSFSSIAYNFYDSVIRYVISIFCLYNPCALCIS